MTDPIADMLTRIRNAVHARHQRVDVPASRFKAEIAKILEREGYIGGFKEMDGEPAPGRRVYLGREDVPRLMGGLGTAILTTSHGVMTGKDAVKAGVGGEVLCNV